MGVAHCDADWNAQAVMSAKSYMEMGGFSRSKLIDQLTSPYGEQFTFFPGHLRRRSRRSVSPGRQRHRATATGPAP